MYIVQLPDDEWVRQTGPVSEGGATRRTDVQRKTEWIKWGNRWSSVALNLLVFKNGAPTPSPSPLSDDEETESVKSEERTISLPKAFFLLAPPMLPRSHRDTLIQQKDAIFLSPGTKGIFSAQRKKLPLLQHVFFPIFRKALHSASDGCCDRSPHRFLMIARYIPPIEAVLSTELCVVLYRFPTLLQYKPSQLSKEVRTLGMSIKSKKR